MQHASVFAVVQVQLRDPGSANIIVRQKGLLIDWEKAKEGYHWDHGAKLSMCVFEMWGLSNIALAVRVSFIGVTSIGSAR